MEKIQKTINDPCLIDLKLGLNSSSINLESTKTKENFSINCEYDRSVKLTIFYEPQTTSQETDNDDSDDGPFGGTDNCGYIDISDWGSDSSEWENDHPEEYPLLIILEHYKGSTVGDGIYVNDLTYQSTAGGEKDRTDDDWCSCEPSKSKGALIYKAMSDNPYNTPRVAYFKHKTKDKVLKSGPKAGYRVLDEWWVTVVQKANPNASGIEVKEEALGSYLYSIGVISNANFDINTLYNKYSTTLYNSDLKNALEYFNEYKYDETSNNKGIEFISNVGDLCINDNKDLIKFEEYYRLYAYNNNVRMFTCLGEYDYMKLYSDELNKNTYNQINKFNMNKIYKDIKYFEYNGSWDQQGSGERNAKGKTNYYYVHENSNTEDNIFIYLSVDYGTSKFASQNGYLSRAINKLDYNDKYVKELIPFAIEGGYNKDIDGNFDYQFYDSNTLIWLKDIIENNLDKHIFVFMHHGFPHKAGNGTSYNNCGNSYMYKYYSENKIYPYDSSYAITKNINNSGSNSLCGLQFYFLNNLNNKYKNVIWVSSHSRYRWEDGEQSFINKFTGDQYLNFCNKDFDIYKPTGNESYQYPGNINSLSKDYEPKIYSRLPLNIDNKRIEDKPISISAWNIHIPSLSCPTTRYFNNELKHASEGAIFDIYENGCKIKQILFKDENTPNYVNKIIGEKRILFGYITNI